MKILFLTHRLPDPPDRGDRIRAHHLLRQMARFADVSLFSLVHDADEEARAARVQGASAVATARVPTELNRLKAAPRLMSPTPMTHLLLDAPGARPALARLVAAAPPDVIVAFGSGMARFALEPPLAGRPWVLDLVDVDSAKWSALAEGSRGWRRWIYRREAERLGGFEARAVREARMTFVVNARERDTLGTLAPDARVMVLPNGIDLEAFRPTGPPASEPRVTFCGVMDYEPNANAAIWFARDVWPLVRAGRPDARLAIVGASPGRAVRALSADDSIEVTGRVDAVQPWLWRSAVGIAPLQVARGVQNKVLESLAAGLPVVVTPAVLAGLPDAVRPMCLSADSARQFADRVIELLGESPVQRRARAEAAPLDELSWPRQLHALEAALIAACTKTIGKSATEP